MRELSFVQGGGASGGRSAATLLRAPESVTTGLPPVLAALAGVGVDHAPLLAAADAAKRSGLDPFDVFCAGGALPEADLVAMLAHALGVDGLGAADHDGPQIDADTFGMAMRTGVLRTRDAAGRVRLVIAARGPAVARLHAARKDAPEPTRSIALASPRAFADLCVARAGAALAERASEGPARLFPHLTVAHGMPRVSNAFRCSIAAALALTIWFALEAAIIAVTTLASVVFAALGAFRLCLAMTPPGDPPPLGQRVPDGGLPVYTVLVGLKGEGACIPHLLDALERLDYPALGIKRTNA